MGGRGSRIGRPILLSGLMLGVWLAGLSAVLWRGSRESGAGPARAATNGPRQPPLDRSGRGQPRPWDSTIPD